MAEPKTDALVKSLESPVAEKQAVTSKERDLIDGLNAVLGKMPPSSGPVQGNCAAASVLCRGPGSG